MAETDAPGNAYVPGDEIDPCPGRDVGTVRRLSDLLDCPQLTRGPPTRRDTFAVGGFRGRSCPEEEGHLEVWRATLPESPLDSLLFLQSRVPGFQSNMCFRPHGTTDRQCLWGYEKVAFVLK